jgi:DNA-binding MarR family transcriptional regulator
MQHMEMSLRLQQSGLKTPAKIPSDAIQRGWVALGRVAPLIQDQVEDALKAAGLPSLSWYTVLWEIERMGAPQRPRDLAIPLFIPRYALSRLVDRMEADGLVKRIKCEEDARGHLLDLTAKGRAMRKEMWAVYAPAMDAAMTRLSDKEAAELTRLLNKLGGVEDVECSEGKGA